MAANEETVSIDTVKKTLWDSLEALGENISGETLTALMALIEGGGSSSNAPLETNVTISVDGETSKQTISTQLTAADLFSAIEAGKFLAVNTTVGDDVFRKIVVVDAQAINAGYEFSFLTVTNGELIYFFANELSAEDTVVFRQI